MTKIYKTTEAAREKTKAWRLANLERVKHYRQENRQKLYRQELVRKYGVEFEWFDKQMNQQNGKCAICEKELKFGNKQTTPHVDHCHLTLKVRGILCNRCNSVIGFIEESKQIIEKMKGYLECHG